MPSPYAESMGMQPGTPPFGFYLNVSGRTRCTNTGQSSITLKASGSDTMLLATSNATDLAMGGVGKPFVEMGRARIQRDVLFEADGGQGEILTMTQIQQPLDLFFASMDPAAQIKGYSRTFSKSMRSMEVCFPLFGFPMCSEINSEQFCGNFGGSCLVESLDASGAPMDPTWFEPALCSYTSTLCGEEEDVEPGVSCLE